MSDFDRKPLERCITELSGLVGKTVAAAFKPRRHGCSFDSDDELFLVFTDGMHAWLQSHSGYDSDTDVRLDETTMGDVKSLAHEQIEALGLTAAVKANAEREREAAVADAKVRARRVEDHERRMYEELRRKYEGR